MYIRLLVAAILIALTATALTLQAATTNAYAVTATAGCTPGSLACAIAVAFGNFAKAVACVSGLPCAVAG